MIHSTCVADYLPKPLHAQGSFILFLKHAYSPRVFPDASATTAMYSTNAQGNVSMPMWQLRGSDMEMLRLVQEALADFEGATYEVRDVSVVREEDMYGDCPNYDVGPFPRGRKIFADVTQVSDIASSDELSDDELDRYYRPEWECDFVVPLITKRLPKFMDGDSPRDRVRYHGSAATGWMDARLKKVTAQRRCFDSTTTVVSMKGWGSPELSNVGQYWGNEGKYEIDWYRRAALIVTLQRAFQLWSDSDDSNAETSVGGTSSA